MLIVPGFRVDATWNDARELLSMGVIGTARLRRLIYNEASTEKPEPKRSAVRRLRDVTAHVRAQGGGVRPAICM